MDTTAKKYKILIVDDDHFLTNMYSIKFKGSGYDVETSLDGQEVLGRLRAGLKPDVMLLDMIMPNMNGLEILEQIRKENLIPDAKVIILSNQSLPSDIDKAKDLGVQGYIVKATTIPSEVVTEVSKILG